VAHSVRDLSNLAGDMFAPSNTKYGHGLRSILLAMRFVWPNLQFGNIRSYRYKTRLSGPFGQPSNVLDGSREDASIGHAIRPSHGPKLAGATKAIYDTKPVKRLGIVEHYGTARPPLPHERKNSQRAK
jgi:hypothetical protein